MSKRVLVIMNSEEDHQFFIELFHHSGDECVYMNNESEAMEVFKNEPFDMVLIDALLPKIRGTEVCRQLKITDKGKSTPILLVGTLMNSFQVAHQAKVKYGADDVLVKPYNPKELERKLALYLDGIQYDKKQKKQKETLGLTTIAEEGVDFSKLQESLPFRGYLNETPFPRILIYFCFFGEDGTLVVEDGQVMKSIVLHGKNPAWVSSNLRNETLGEILLEKGLINQEQLQESLREMRESDRRLGEVLLEKEAITPHDLFESIAYQAREKIIDIFSWESGNYTFSLEMPDMTDTFPLEINVSDLVLDGIIRHWSANAVDEELKDSENLAIFPTKEGYERAKKIVHNQKVQRILDAVDGRLTVKEILDSSPYSHVETKQILLVLMMIEAVVLAPVVLSANKDEKIFKDLGTEPVYDESPLGKEYANSISNTFGNVQQYDIDKLYAFDPESPDYVSLDSQHEQWIDRIKDNEQYNNADRITRAKADYLLQTYDRTYNILSNPDQYKEYKEAIAEQTKAGHQKTAFLASEEHFRKGRELYDLGKYGEAKAQFQKAIELHSGTAEYFAFLANALYLSGDPLDSNNIKQVTGLIDEAIGINPHLDISYLFLGNIAKNQEEFDKAEALYEKVLEHNSKNIRALRELRQIFLKRKIEQESKAQTLPPDVMEQEHSVNELYQKMSNMNFFDLLEADQSTSHDDLRKNYFDLSAKYRPNESFDQLSEIVQERAEVIFQRLTEAYATLIDYDARKEYIDSIASSASFEQEEKAEEEVERNIEAAKGFYRKGRTLLGNREYKTASLMFNKALAADPLTLRYQAYMAQAIYQAFKGREDTHQAALIKAKELVINALSKDPQCADCHVVMGRIYYSEGKRLLAEEQIELAFRIDSENIEALRLFHQLHSKFKGPARAKYLKKDEATNKKLQMHLQQKLSEMNEMNYFELLDVPKGADSQRVKEAFKEKMLSITEEVGDKELPVEIRNIVNEITSLLKSAYKILSSKRDSEIYLQTITEKEKGERFDVENVEDPRKLFSMGKLLIREGLFDKALEAFEKADKLEPKNANYLSWLGFATFKADSNNPESRAMAKEIIDSSLDLEMDNAEAYVLMAKIFKFEKDTYTAKQLFKRALAHDPGNHEAKRQLDLYEKRSAIEKPKNLWQAVKGIFKKNNE